MKHLQHDHLANSRQRQPQAATLVLTLAVAFFTALVGMLVIFGSMVFGGHREVTNATDAGALQVGRDSLTAVNIDLKPDEQRFAGLGDPRQPGDKIDLLSYNRLAGMALLVHMNALADDTAESSQNANAIATILEGPNGIADRLRAKLNDGKNLSSNFDEAFNKFSKRMTGQDKGTGLPENHEIAYIGQDGSLPSNMEVSFLADAGKSPVIDFRSGKIITLPPENIRSSGSANYISGYKSINLVPGVKPIVAVPVLPTQSHLVSFVDFNKSTAFLPHETMVPPNGFRSHASVTDRYNRANISTSAAIAGVGQAILLESTTPDKQRRLSTTFRPEIPCGYITIYNNGQWFPENSMTLSARPNEPEGTLDYHGLTGTSQKNVTAHELGKGIDIDPDSGFFALSESKQLSAWKDHTIHHAGFPRERSGTESPHFASLPQPDGINNPVWENVLLHDSHRDYCWKTYRGNTPPMGKRDGVSVDEVDPLILEERFGSVPEYNELFDPRHNDNVLKSQWKNPMASSVSGAAQKCGNGTIAPGAVHDVVTAHWVAYCNMGNPIETVLDVTLSQSSRLAQDMWKHQQLDNAYYGCNGWAYANPIITKNVTAAEAIKMAVYDAYGTGPKPEVPPCTPLKRDYASGFRPYAGPDPAQGEPAPYRAGSSYSDPSRKGVVTRAASLEQMFDQIDSSRTNLVTRFLKSRLKQIKADVTDSEMDEILRKPLEMSATPYFIYLGSDHRFVLSQNKPPITSFVPVPNSIDGRVFTSQRSYELLDTMVNPALDNDIHDRLFMKVLSNSTLTGPPVSKARETAQFATSSGFNLELGKIAFRQDAMCDLEMCDRN